MHMIKVSRIGWVAGAGLGLALAHAAPLYENDFEKATVGKVPPDMLVLDGGFTVIQEGANKALELPGAPLDAFGVLFGPSVQEDINLAVRVYGTSERRRYPTFGISLDGASGYRLQVTPAKGLVELFRGDTSVASVPFKWQSGTWTQLRLQVRKVKPSEWRVEGKAWANGTTEPAGWTVQFTDKEAPRAGRPGLFGSPFAGTPIRYDDLVLTPVASPHE